MLDAFGRPFGVFRQDVLGYPSPISIVFDRGAKIRFAGYGVGESVVSVAFGHRARIRRGVLGVPNRSVTRLRTDGS